MIRIVYIRLMHMIPVLIGVTFLAFVIVNLLPGNLADAIAGPGASPATLAKLTHEFHLDQPILERYWTWLWAALHGNLGNSVTTNEGVLSAIGAAAPPSVELVIYAQIIAIVLGVSTAVIAVLTPWPWVDRLASGLALLGNSLPAFVTGLIALFVFAVHLHLIGSLGWKSPSEGIGANLGAITLPALVLGVSVFPSYMRVFRREMIDQLDTEEYVSLAKMKGLSKFRVVTHHVARNSALGLLTLVGLSTGVLIGGAVIIDQVFTIPGLGSLLIAAINTRDAPVLLGCILVIGICIVMLNLIADLLYAVLDPRTRT
jgi:peptide/nickel transport system permease protein